MACLSSWRDSEKDKELSITDSGWPRCPCTRVARGTHVWMMINEDVAGLIWMMLYYADDGSTTTTVVEARRLRKKCAETGVNERRKSGRRIPALRDHRGFVVAGTEREESLDRAVSSKLAS